MSVKHTVTLLNPVQQMMQAGKSTFVPQHGVFRRQDHPLGGAAVHFNNVAILPSDGDSTEVLKSKMRYPRLSGRGRCTFIPGYR